MEKGGKQKHNHNHNHNDHLANTQSIVHHIIHIEIQKVLGGFLFMFLFSSLFHWDPPFSLCNSAHSFNEVATQREWCLRLNIVGGRRSVGRLHSSSCKRSIELFIPIVEACQYWWWWSWWMNGIDDAITWHWQKVKNPFEFVWQWTWEVFVVVENVAYLSQPFFHRFSPNFMHEVQQINWVSM